MKQRIKPCNFTTKSTLGLLRKEVFTNEDGVLVIDAGGVRIFLCPAQVQEILARVQLEPVPEPKTPGQVLHEAQGAEVCPFTVNWRPWEDLSDREKDYRERVARRLEIKGEG